MSLINAGVSWRRGIFRWGIKFNKITVFRIINNKNIDAEIQNCYKKNYYLLP